MATRLQQRRIEPAFVIAWSAWRRAHQAMAQTSHIGDATVPWIRGERKLVAVRQSPPDLFVGPAAALKVDFSAILDAAEISSPTRMPFNV